MTKRITGLAIALLLSAAACKRREEATAPTAPTTVPTVAPPQPVAVLDAGPTQPGPNAMAQPGTVAPVPQPGTVAPVPQPGTLAPGAAPPTGAPPAAPIAAAPAAPVAPTAPAAPTPPANTNHPTEIRIPGLANQPPINIDQNNGQTRVNVGGIQLVLPSIPR
jgi:fused signal recognition particle receptor